MKLTRKVRVDEMEWRFNKKHKCWVKQLTEPHFNVVSFTNGWGEPSPENLNDWAQTINLNNFTETDVLCALSKEKAYLSIAEFHQDHPHLSRVDFLETVAISIFNRHYRVELEEEQSFVK